MPEVQETVAHQAAIFVSSPTGPPLAWRPSPRAALTLPLARLLLVPKRRCTLIVLLRHGQLELPVACARACRDHGRSLASAATRRHCVPVPSTVEGGMCDAVQERVMLTSGSVSTAARPQPGPGCLQRSTARWNLCPGRLLPGPSTLVLVLAGSRAPPSAGNGHLSTAWPMLAAEAGQCGRATRGACWHAWPEGLGLPG